MANELKLSAINPFALGEEVLGKKVKWEELENPEETLAGILNVPKDELFAHDSILINPSLTERGEILSAEKAKARLKNYMELRTQKRITLKTKLTKQIALKNISQKTIDSVFREISPKSSDKNTEWNPSGVTWLDKGDYFEDLAELTDPTQGNLADCYFISALSSVAWSRPYAIINATSPYKHGDEECPLHQISFYNSKGTKEDIQVSELAPCNANTQKLLYASSNDEGEIWPAIMEKAYAKWKSGNTTDRPDFTTIEYGDCVEACRQLIGGTKSYLYNKDATNSEISSFIRSNSLSARTINPMTAWTYKSQPSGCDYSKAGIVANHAYSILGWMYKSPDYYVVLRNPWGTHPGTLDTLSGKYTGIINGFSNYFTLGKNGIFAMKVSTFKKYFAGLGVVK